jgi:hypothetical protein
MWVAPVAALAEVHGWVAVYESSLRVLGFPPVMITDSDEVRRVEVALRGGQPDDDDATL